VPHEIRWVLSSAVEEKGTPFFRGALCFGPVEFDARKGYANKLPL
jgi:hypothetical protein